MLSRNKFVSEVINSASTLIKYDDQEQLVMRSENKCVQYSVGSIIDPQKCISKVVILNDVSKPK
jgi:hypothetical protein